MTISDDEEAEPKYIEKENDLRALRTLILTIRRLPVPLIQQQMGIERTQVYRDIKRAKEILDLKPGDIIHDLLLMNDDILREAWIHYQQVRDMPDLDVKTRNTLEMSILNQINQVISTRINAAKLLMPKSESTTITSIPTVEGQAVRVEVKRDLRPLGELFKEIEKQEEHKKEEANKS